LYGFEAWYLTVREKQWLRVSENCVLRNIFGSKRDKLRGEWRKLHNEEFDDLYSSPNIFRVIKSRRMRWAEHVVMYGDRRGAYRVLAENPEGYRPFGGPRRRWKANIKIELQEVR
jgi:hypothetical protein